MNLEGRMSTEAKWPPRDPRKEFDKVNAWNQQHPVGCKVRVRLDSGADVDTFTVAPASVLSGHTAVLWLKNISGWVVGYFEFSHA
jgi:hypothetical protein